MPEYATREEWIAANPWLWNERAYFDLPEDEARVWAAVHDTVTILRVYDGIAQMVAAAPDLPPHVSIVWAGEGEG